MLGREGVVSRNDVRRSAARTCATRWASGSPRCARTFTVSAARI